MGAQRAVPPKSGITGNQPSNRQPIFAIISNLRIRKVIKMNIKRMVAWAVALAVLVIFLLGLSPLGNLSVFGISGVAGILAIIGLFFVGAVAAVVAIYWGKE
jgi:hypothetical protein